MHSTEVEGYNIYRATYTSSQLNRFYFHLTISLAWHDYLP